MNKAGYFLEAISEYIDQDFLLAGKDNRKPTTPGTNGNPLTDVGIVACVYKSINEETDPIVLDRLDLGVQSLESLVYPGIWNKKARSSDEVTHDDLIGLVAFSSILGHNYHKELYKFMAYHNGLMSNTGVAYWDARTKPWHAALYKMSVDVIPSWLEYTALFFFFISNGILKSDSNGQRLVWMMACVLEGKNKKIDYAIKLWKAGVKRNWGTVGNILSDYYGMVHPLAVYCSE